MATLLQPASGQSRAETASSLAEARRAGTVSRIGKRLFHEPLLHFLLLGAALFVLNHYLQERSRYLHIQITQEQIRHIADNYHRQYGSSPQPRQLEALIDRYVDEEVLYRRALELGLDRDDEIIRRRLVQKSAFLQEDLAPPAEPTGAQLLEYYERHLEQYRIPARVSFTHVYFSPDLHGEEGARAAAEALASVLNQKRTVRAADQGDPFPGTYDFADLSREELDRVFGQQGLAEAIFRVAPQRWSTPLRSGFGWHTVYVTTQEPARQGAFEEVSERVRNAYLEVERTRRNIEALARLRHHFVITREPSVRTEGPK